jgi:hypothetical protein
MSTALAYKSEVMRNVIYPLNDEFFDQNRDRNIRYFTKYNPHLFGRVLERKIDKKTFTEIFELLFKNHYDILLAIFENDKEKMNSKDSVAIFVRRKDVSICFIVFDDGKDGYFTLMPLTVLGKNGYKKCDYEINL